MDILSLINDGDWLTAIKNVQPLFESLEDGKNLFHYACIRGQKQIIDLFVKIY
jgi:glycosidase